MNEFDVVNTVVLIIGVVLFLLLVSFSIVSMVEKETKAATRSFFLSLILPLPYVLITLISFQFQKEIAWIFIILTSVFLIVLFFSIRRKSSRENITPKNKYDERDIIFSRRDLKEGSNRYEEYYRKHPEKKKPDDNFRSKPGLLSPKSELYDPLTFASSDASFFAVSGFYDLVDGNVSETKINTEPSRITNYIKKWSKKLGALNVGVTKFKEYHKYSNAGRSDSYGESVELNHKYAIAFTVEMDKFQLGASPAGPTVMESAQQYLESGSIAIQVAAFIRSLGYPARAHIDGNYQVLCPLVARDAGLGEIGRMGLLMTPNLGPRVRISVVTTDIPLIDDECIIDNTISDFCEKCNKCAVNCPPKAISFDEMKMIDGIKRWKINSESCYTYWCTSGTDCGRCMSVCPYSHPDNFIHNFVRAGIRNSTIFRRFAIKMDDFFYGKKPKSLEVPEWMKIDDRIKDHN